MSDSYIATGQAKRRRTSVSGSSKDEVSSSSSEESFAKDAQSSDAEEDSESELTKEPPVSSSASSSSSSSSPTPSSPSQISSSSASAAPLSPINAANTTLSSLSLADQNPNQSTSLRYRAFQRMLSSADDQALFRQFLNSEHAPENIDFFCAVRSFKAKCDSAGEAGLSEIIQIGEDIYKQYFLPFCSLNLSSSIVSSLKMIFQGSDSPPFSALNGCYNAALDSISELMFVDSFPRFIRCPNYSSKFTPDLSELVAPLLPKNIPNPLSPTRVQLDDDEPDEVPRVDPPAHKKGFLSCLE